MGCRRGGGSRPRPPSKAAGGVGSHPRPTQGYREGGSRPCQTKATCRPTTSTGGQGGAGAGVARVPAGGAGEGAAHAPNQIKAAGCVAHAPARSNLGGWASNAPETMARRRGWPTPAGKYSRRSWATGATTHGAWEVPHRRAPHRSRRGSSPRQGCRRSGGSCPRSIMGCGGGGDHAPAHLRAAGGAAHAPTQLRAAERGRLMSPPI
jgi:hypothetical protein